MMRKFTIKFGIVLFVLVSAINSFSQINPKEIKYWVGSGSDTAYLAIKPTSEYDQTTKVWGYLYDGVKTIDDLVLAVNNSDVNVSITTENEIDVIEMNCSQWGCDLEGTNSGTTSWNIFSSDLTLTNWAVDKLLTDALLNQTVYGLAFNSDEETITTNPQPEAPYAYQENSSYHDASISKVDYFVGIGDFQTVILLDFKNPYYKKSLAFGVNFSEGETLKDALDKLQTAYAAFSYDAGTYLNNITFDTLSKDDGLYFSVLSNDLSDQLGSVGGPGISEVMTENSYYSFVISKYSPSDLVPVFAPSLLSKKINSDEIKYWVGEGSDTSYVAVNMSGDWDKYSKVWGYLHDGTKTIDDLFTDLSDTDEQITITKSSSIDKIVMGWTTSEASVTSHWSIFKSDVNQTDLGLNEKLNDIVVKGNLYAAVFNAFDVNNTGVSQAVNEIVYQESPTFHDASISEVNFFVGEGDKTTVLLIDFKNPNYKKSLAYGVRFSEGETLEGALTKLTIAYNGFSFAVKEDGYLDSISIDTLNDLHAPGKYWNYNSNDLNDNVGSTSTGKLGEVILTENSYYGFSYSKGTPSALRPVFSPAANENGSNAIAKDSSVIVSWATSSELTRGFVQIDDESITDKEINTASYGEASNATGIAEGTSAGVVSLGDEGVAILTFDTPIKNDVGADFAVFENGFATGNLDFLELAFVEVSSDGENYFRFPSISLTNGTEQIGSFGGIDTKNISNLAGKFNAGFGTPFDLEDLSDIDGLDINSITHIKIIDVVGTINPMFASIDSKGNIINDPYPTASSTGGFDLDGVAVLNENTVSALSTVVESTLAVYPNPAVSTLNISLKVASLITIHNVNGMLVYSEDLNEGVTSIDVIKSGLSSGMYFVQTEGAVVTKLIIK